MKKTGVTFKDNALVVNGKSEYIYSGEMHYFRIKKKDWLDRIVKAKKAHLNTISSYIPWRWHEPTESTFDFTGKSFPERDLISLLELLKKENIYFIARIGPVSNGEIIDDGLPEWLFSSYPAIRLKNYAGKTNPYSSLIDYHNPDYHELIQKWYAQLIPILKKYLVSEGGPIIVIQLDNEISMLNWLTQSPTYSDYSNQLFQDYMKTQFKDIELLNKKLATSFKSFEEIKQPDGSFDFSKGAFILEWANYYREFYAQFYKKLYSYLKEYDVNLPVIANIPQIYDYDVKGRGNMGIMTTSMFKYFKNYVDDIIFGGAYQYRRLDYENFTDITAMTEIVRMITPKPNPMICAEMQTGIMFDRPVLYPSDVALNIKTSLATGLNGINGYMYAGGRNFLNMGGFGHYHNWQAAVGDDGSLAPHYDALQEAGEVIQGISSVITQTHNVPEINIGLYLPYYQTEYLSGDIIQQIMHKRDYKLFDGLLRLLRLAGYNYRFINLKEISDEDLAQYSNLWIFSLEFMDPQTQQKIADYTEKSKNIFIFPAVPEYDLNYKKCEILKSSLNIKSVVHKNFGANRLKKAGDDYLFYGGDEVYTYEVNSEKNMTPLFYTEDDMLSAIKIDQKNSKIILCGFDLTHKFDFQIDFIEDFAKLLDIHSEVRNKNRRANAIIRKGEQSNVLFVANYTEIPQKVKLNLQNESFPVDLPLSLPGRQSYLLLANYKLSDNAKINFISSEVIKISEEKDRIKFKIRKNDFDILVCHEGKSKVQSNADFKIVKDDKSFQLLKIDCKDQDCELIFTEYKN